jgi:muramoyltetrapeptide carboxypeptidase
MIFAPFLKENDLVALTSPAGKIDPIHIKNAQMFLNSKNLKTIVPIASASYHQFAATDKQRAAGLQIMINNPDVKAIWCTRGGYGTMRLIDKLDLSALIKYPKWLIGFSDITVLHSLFREKNIASIHGPMCINLSNECFETSGVDTLFNLLFGNIPEYELLPHSLNRNGKSTGTLIGGNLSLLCALAGSKYDFNPHGKILFIEDVGEYLYKFDRMIQSLKISGKLAALSGLIIGQITDMKDNETPFGMSAYEIVADAVADYDYPLMFDFFAGHHKRNEPLILGAQVEMEVMADKSKLIFNTGEFNTTTFEKNINFAP